MKTVDLLNDNFMVPDRAVSYHVYKYGVSIPRVIRIILIGPKIIRFATDEWDFAQMNKDQFGEFIQHLQELHSKMKS